MQLARQKRPTEILATQRRASSQHSLLHVCVDIVVYVLTCGLGRHKKRGNENNNNNSGVKATVGGPI